MNYDHIMKSKERKTFITLEFESDKHLQDFIKRGRLEDIRTLLKGEKIDYYLTWEAPLA